MRRSFDELRSAHEVSGVKQLEQIGGVWIGTEVEFPHEVLELCCSALTRRTVEACAPLAHLLPRDGLSFELGVLGFRSGDPPPFTFIGNNDRIFFKASYGL
jgi:hypothetical protein